MTTQTICPSCNTPANKPALPGAPWCWCQGCTPTETLRRVAILHRIATR